MSLWVDKYCPTSLDKLTYHKPLTTQLKNLAGSGDLPHLLFYGPSGAGKKTRITATLREIFGSSVEKVKVDRRAFETPSGRKIEINTLSSNLHIELNPSDVGGTYDRVVVQELIKEVAQTQQLSAKASRRFKIVVIHEADSLSRDAQNALRRTMEKYVGSLRMILCCNSVSKITPPVQSRCLLIRVSAPTIQEIKDNINMIAKKEKLTVPSEFAEYIATHSKRNMRRAILMLESAYVQQYPFTSDQRVALPDYEVAIAQIAKSALEDQSPARLSQIRTQLYELLSHCIPAQLILKELSMHWIKSVDDELKAEMVRYAALYDHRLQVGQKAIFHLEAYVAKFMSIYKRFLLDISGTRPTELHLIMGQKKFRVLCLHGYSQNGDAFRIKSRGLRSSIDSLAELAFIDAPHSTLWAESADFNEREHENQIKARRYQGGNEPRCWWHTSQYPAVRLVGIEESLKVVKQTLEEEGPFDGIIGFSQGAAFAAIICGLLEGGSCAEHTPRISHPPFRFAMLFGGYVVGDHQWSPVVKSTTLATSSLHVFASDDPTVSSARSLTLSQCFSHPTVFEHPGGHHIPMTAPAKRAYLEFVEGVLRREK